MRRILITGGNRGLGLEFTRQLLARGETVFAGARQPEQAAQLHELAGQYSERLVVFPLDVTDAASIDNAFDLVATRVDGLDVLINNAGIFNKIKSAFGEGTDPKFGHLDAENLLAVYKVNSVGPVMMTQRFYELLKKGNQPKVINLSSLVGSIGLKNVGGYYAYSASKAALNMFTRLLAYDLERDGITVVSLHPGWVQTEMGGSRAPLPAAKSVAGMIKVIDSVGPADSGAFRQYTGEPMDW